MNKKIILCVALCLGGCYKVGPDYHKPTVAVPKAWRFSSENARETVNANWWREFSDPELDRLIERVLTGNLDIKIAIANVEQFMGAYGTTRADLFPQISGGAQYSRQQTSAKNFPGLEQLVGNSIPESDVANIGANVFWQLDVWGQLRRAKEAAFADLISQRYAQDAILLTTVSLAVQTYIDLRTLDAILDVTRQTVDSLEQQNHINQVRFNMGYTSELELTQSHSELERRKALIPLYEQRIAQTEHALSVLLGANPRAIVRGKTLYEITPPNVPAGLPSDLLQRRPDIQQAEQNMIAANARIGVAKGEYFPKIQLTGNIGQASAELGQLFTPGANVWAIGTRILGPIFTAGKIAGLVQSAEGAKKAAFLNYQKTVLNSFREFEDSLVAKTKTAQRLEDQTKRVEAVASYLKLSQVRYDEGYVDYISLLDALRQFYEAKIDQTQAYNDHLVAIITLYKAMGGGWVNTASSKPENRVPTAKLYP